MTDEEIKLEDERIAAEKKAGIIPQEMPELGGNGDNFDGVGDDDRAPFDPNGGGGKRDDEDEDDDEGEVQFSKTKTITSNGGSSFSSSSTRTSQS